MKWLSLDTDIFSDAKIKTLLRKQGGEGYTVYNYILAQVAGDIDIDNEENGYFETGNGECPTESIAWDLHFDTERIKEILDLLADLELIDPEKWADGKVFVPKMLERKQIKTYLRKQQGGRKGGESSPSSSPSRSPSSTPSTDKDIDRDKEVDKDKIKTLYNYWKEKSETITHRKLTKPMKKSIKARLKDYSVDELKEAIDNYNMVVKSDDYFFSYDNWSLDEFLSRGEGKQVEKFLTNPDAYLQDDNDSGKNKSTRRHSSMTEEEREELGL